MDPKEDIETPNDGSIDKLEGAEGKVSGNAAKDPVKGKAKWSYYTHPIPLLFFVFIVMVAHRGFQLQMMHHYKNNNRVSIELVYNGGIVQGGVADLKSAKEYLVDQNVSKLEDLNREGSPQNRALKILEGQAPPKGDRNGYDYVTRYVLAVLYYSTNGPKWIFPLNFLATKGPICSWYQELKYPDDSKELRGVVCNDNKQITSLLLSRNQLRGSLPTELALLTSLTTLDVSFNQLKGSIPDTFYKLSNLETLLASSIALTGSIPDWIDQWSNIQKIDLSGNALSGSIPHAIEKLSNLKGIALNGNMISGSLSFGARGLANLESFFVDDNYLTGSLDPGFLGASTALRHLDLSNNYLKGSVSKHLFGFPQLQVLDLSDNQFDELSDIIHEQKSLYLLALQKNNFANQPIPPSISNLKNLTHLDVSQNAFTGEIPPQIANLDLTYLFVAQNGFVPGPLPSWIQSMTNLQELDLKSTHRTGTIPSFLGDLSDLVLLDLDNNQLEGSIPESLGSLSNLHILLVNRNNLTSSVPPSFANLKSLKLMFLEGNTDITGGLDELCVNDDEVATKPVIVADCNLCDPYKECCAECCQPGDRCNKGVFVPDLDPIWQLGYKRVFFTFNRDYYLEKHAKKVFDEAEAEARPPNYPMEEALESEDKEEGLEPEDEMLEPEVEKELEWRF